MAFQKRLFYLGSEEIVRAGGSLQFKLTDHVFDDDDAAVLSRDTDERLFYAHDPELGFLVVRAEFSEDGRYWYDTVGDRFVNLGKPTENIRRITIVKAVRENPGGSIDSVDWEFSAGNTVHYVTTENMIQESPKSFYILYTNQVERFMRERNLTWKREVDKQRLRKGGFSHLADIERIEEGSKPQEKKEKPSNEVHETTEIESKVKVREVEIQIEAISNETYSIIDLNYLLVRFGVNEVIAQDPSAADNPLFDIRNDVYSVESDHRDRTLVAKIPLRIHSQYPTEFKLFVDVDDPDRLEEVKEKFASSPSCISASISGSLEDRVYFLLKEFGVTKTPEGILNNVVYPK